MHICIDSAVRGCTISREASVCVVCGEGGTVRLAIAWSAVEGDSGRLTALTAQRYGHTVIHG